MTFELLPIEGDLEHAKRGDLESIRHSRGGADS
jgi:hypothetical protein